MAGPLDPDFAGRLQRVHRIHRKGGGFEAAGTLGKSTMAAKPARRSYLRGALLVAGAFILIKALLLAQIGAASYSARVDALKDGGSTVEQIGAYVMQADPVTVWVADTLRKVVLGA